MAQPHTEVAVYHTHNCDFCSQGGKQHKADYDGRTIYGAWAYMCQTHFALYGVGLGLGRGQRLLLQKKEVNNGTKGAR